AKYLVLAEHAAYCRVDSAIRSHVMPERLLQHQARVRGVQPGRGKLLANDREEGRRSCQVHHHRAGLPLPQSGRQPLVILGSGKVEWQEAQQGRELVEFRGAGLLLELDLLEAGADERAVLLVVQVVACGAYDAAVLGQGAVAEGLEQGGHQLAPGEVAGAAEQDKIEAHGYSRETIGYCNLVSKRNCPNQVASAQRARRLI